MTDKSPNYAQKKFDYCNISAADLKLSETAHLNGDELKEAESQHDYQQNPAYGAIAHQGTCPTSQPVSQEAQFSAEINGPVAIPLMNVVRISSTVKILSLTLCLYTACR